jgi:hypothetical protein
MSYQIVVSGHVDSEKAEAEVLAKAIAFAEETSSEGGFAFTGIHFNIHSGPIQVQTAAAREALAAYNERADADDEVDAPTLNTRGDAP